MVQHLNLPALPPLALSISPQDQTVTLLKDCGKKMSSLARCRDSWILSQSDLTRLQLGTELSSSSVALRYFMSRGPLEDSEVLYGLLLPFQAQGEDVGAPAGLSERKPIPQSSSTLPVTPAV